MAHSILIKRSATSTAVPTGGQLAAGELAINTADEKIFFKNSAGTVKSLSAMSDLTSNLVTISTNQTITGLKTFSGLTTFSEHIVVNSKKELRLADADSSNYVAFMAPTTVSNNNVYTLPSAVGSANQVLQIASVAGNDATLQWATVSGGGSPGGSDTQVQFNDGGSTFGGDAGLTYNKTTDTLTIAGDLAVNGGDITTSASTFNIATTAATVNIATSSASAQTFTFGSNVSGSTINWFGGSAMVATYISSKVANSLFFAVGMDEFGFYGANVSMGYGCTALTSLGDWEGSGNGNVITVDDAASTITFYAAGANSYTFPSTRGSNGQVLTTNGSGTLTWSTVSGGSSDYSTPEIMSLISQGVI